MRNHELATNIDHLHAMFYFLDFANQGRHKGASGEEKACARLATALLLDYASLDTKARAGAIAWADYIDRRPATARNMYRTE